jgi:hypothetical protein
MCSCQNILVFKTVLVHVSTFCGLNPNCCTGALQFLDETFHERLGCLQHQSTFPELTRSRWDWVQKVTVGTGRGYGSQSEPTHKSSEQGEQGVQMYAHAHNNSTTRDEDEQLPAADKAEVRIMCRQRICMRHSCMFSDKGYVSSFQTRDMYASCM